MNNPHQSFVLQDLIAHINTFSEDWECDEMLGCPVNSTYYGDDLFMSLFVDDDDELMLEISHIGTVGREPQILDMSIVYGQDPKTIFEHIDGIRKAITSMLRNSRGLS